MSDTPQTPEGDDEALRRVRSVDPSLDYTPDAEAIRRGVDEHLAVGDELAARRHGGRRRAVWVGAAAGVCALALAAGAGFSAGRTTSPQTTAARAPFTLSPAQGGPAADSAQAGMGAPNVVSPELGAPLRDVGVSASKMAMPYWGGRTVFLAADGLPTTGGSAPAYGYDARAVDGAEAAARLAKALGLKGAPQGNEGGTIIGPADGSGPNLSVGLDGMRNFYYYDPTVDPYRCVTPVPEPMPAESKGSDGSGSAGSTGSDPAQPCQQPTEPGPSAEKAIAAAQAFMTEVGVDPAGFEWAADSSTPGMTYVNAMEVIDGQQTGVGWGFQAIRGGTFSAVNGFLAPHVTLGDYEVISPRAAVDRLNDARFGAGFGGWPMPMAEARGGVAADGSVSSGEAQAAPAKAPEVPALPKPGSPIGWPVTQVTITGCELGLAQNYQPNGAVLLVPTYQCSAGKDQGYYTVIAVADSQLNTSTG